MLKEIVYCGDDHDWLPNQDEPMVCKKCQYLHPDYSIIKLVEYVMVLEEVSVILGQEMMRLYSDTKKVVEGYQTMREEFDSTRSDVNEIKEVFSSKLNMQQAPTVPEGENQSE